MHVTSDSKTDRSVCRADLNNELFFVAKCIKDIGLVRFRAQLIYLLRIIYIKDYKYGIFKKGIDYKGI